MDLIMKEWLDYGGEGLGRVEQEATEWGGSGITVNDGLSVSHNLVDTVCKGWS